MAATIPRLNPITFVRRAGPRVALRKLAEQAWWTKVFFGLRCDLSALPAVRPAAIPVAMEARDPLSFTGFADELGRVEGDDYVQVVLRTMSCEAGLESLYVTTGEEGRPAYAQWLTLAAEQARLHEHSPGRYPVLADNEALLEGAYTFVRFRRLGLMADGMKQLLERARDAGCTSAFTYVEADNVPSLRGCANVGFDLDHVRLNERRLGRRTSEQKPPDAQLRDRWKQSTAPRAVTGQPPP